MILTSKASARYFGYSYKAEFNGIKEDWGTLRDGEGNFGFINV